MKLRFVLALAFLFGEASSQESGKDVAPRKSPFILDRMHFEGPREPVMLSTSDFELWKLASKVASEPPARPFGVGIGIGGPSAVLKIANHAGKDGAGFEIAIYPRAAKDETGLMGIQRITELADHVREERYLGWFDDKALRALCETESMRVLAKRAAATPLQVFSTIGRKEGSPGVWLEKVHVVNVSDEPLLIDNVNFQVLKAGTMEELRKTAVTWPPKMKRIGGKRRIELLPRRTWLALSTEWDAFPELATLEGSAAVVVAREDEASRLFRVEVNRYIEAEVERH